MLILTNSINSEKPFPSNPLLLIFYLIWVQQARIIRLEPLNRELAAELDRLYREGKCAA